MNDLDSPTSSKVHAAGTTTSAELLAAIQAAGLSENEKQALAWHLFDGLSYQQIADWQDCSKAGAKKRVARAIAKLAEAGVPVAGFDPASRPTVTVTAVSKLGREFRTANNPDLKALAGEGD